MAEKSETAAPLIKFLKLRHTHKVAIIIVLFFCVYSYAHNLLLIVNGFIKYFVDLAVIANCTVTREGSSRPTEGGGM